MKRCWFDRLCKNVNFFFYKTMLNFLKVFLWYFKRPFNSSQSQGFVHCTFDLPLCLSRDWVGIPLIGYWKLLFLTSRFCSCRFVVCLLFRFSTFGYFISETRLNICTDCWGLCFNLVCVVIVPEQFLHYIYVSFLLARFFSRWMFFIFFRCSFNLAISSSNSCLLLEPPFFVYGFPQDTRGGHREGEAQRPLGRRGRTGRGEGGPQGGAGATPHPMPGRSRLFFETNIIFLSMDSY